MSQPCLGYQVTAGEELMPRVRMHRSVRKQIGDQQFGLVSNYGFCSENDVVVTVADDETADDLLMNARLCTPPNMSKPCRLD